MNLDRFRDVADEKLSTLIMTARMRENILIALKKQKPRRNQGALYVAAACLVVMALSAGVLALGNLGGWLGGGEPAGTNAEAAGVSAQIDSDALDPITGYSGVTLSVNLSPSIKTEGIVPMQDAETGLWGYADANGDWVVQPEYAETFPINGIAGRAITTAGEEILLLMKE